MPTIVYGVTRRTPLVAVWDDVRWDVLFNDNDFVVAGDRGTILNSGERHVEQYDNGFPKDWFENPMAWREETGQLREGTSYEGYGQDSRYLFEMGLAWSVVHMLRDNLSPLVRSFLDPMREQYRDSELHLCTHIRQGNNETGDWEKKKWRHIDFDTVANATLASMRRHAVASGATKVTVFVASDSDKTRPWFESHVPEAGAWSDRGRCSRGPSRASGLVSMGARRTRSCRRRRGTRRWQRQSPTCLLWGSATLCTCRTTAASARWG